MRKTLANTRVAVKLRKSETKEEWYLYVEAYPVYDCGTTSPKRVREYINRSITTPIWDRKQESRPSANGEKRYKPKRDVNGVISR